MVVHFWYLILRRNVQLIGIVYPFVIFFGQRKRENRTKHRFHFLRLRTKSSVWTTRFTRLVIERSSKLCSWLCCSWLCRGLLLENRKPPTLYIFFSNIPRKTSRKRKTRAQHRAPETNYQPASRSRRTEKLQKRSLHENWNAAAGTRASLSPLVYQHAQNMNMLYRPVIFDSLGELHFRDLGKIGHFGEM